MFDPNRDTSKAFLRGLYDIEYWRALAPNLTVMGDTENTALEFTDDALKSYNQKLVKEGYVQIRSPGVDTPITELTALFTKFVEMGLPPVFAFVYDELWNLNAQLRNIMAEVVDDGFLMLPDFWCWHVPSGKSGWGPHRDKDADSLMEDRRPKWATVWIPITEAHPENSCMYVLPADRDPMYGVMGAHGWRGNLSDVRALPGDPGDVYIWTQHLMHWGSRSVKGHNRPPRMSIAFEYQRIDVPPRDIPLIDPVKAPGFEERLALIAKQIWYYRQMLGRNKALFDVSKDIHSRVGHTLTALDATPKKKQSFLERFSRKKAAAK